MLIKIKDNWINPRGVMSITGSDMTKSVYIQLYDKTIIIPNEYDNIDEIARLINEYKIRDNTLLGVKK